MLYRNCNKQFRKTRKGKLVLAAFLATVAVLFTTVFLAQTAGENQGYRTISVIEVSGNVSVVKDKIEYRAYPGMLLQEGHEIVAAANSYVRLELDGDKYVKLESGSRAVFETLGLLGSGKTSIRLERGALVTEITKPLQEDDDFIINTPNAVLAVRGTFFRVDLGIFEKGEVKADVMTYGGKVASQRVLPTGEKIDEEVMIEAGFKTSINMTSDDTYYVVETEDGESIVVDTVPPEEEADAVRPTVPIVADDISDDDLIDVYFAAENGHELFVTVEEAKADLEAREIDVKEYTSVYQKAEEVKKVQEKEINSTGSNLNTTSANIKADDGQPIAKVEENAEDKNVNNSTNAPFTNGDIVSNIGNSGLIDGEHKHREKRTTKEATCTESGFEVVVCRDCKETISIKEIPSPGHSLGEWVVIKEATCTEAGSKSKYCLQCDATIDVTEIAALGHNMVNTGYVAPNCTKAGAETYRCDCGYTYTSEAEALGHDFAETFTVDKEVTCTEAGSKSKHCSRCSEKKDVTEIVALGHDWNDWTEVSAATCEETGENCRECTLCKETEKETIAALGHTEVNGQTEEAHLKCDVCNTVLSNEHIYVENVVQEAGCIVNGEIEYACDCGYVYTEELPAYGHTPIDGSEQGVHSKCLECGTTLVVEHQMTNTVYVAPSCTRAGSDTYECDCGYSYTNEVPALGHRFAEEFTTDIEATCTDVGSKSKHCSQCSEKSEVTEIVALGHDWSEWAEFTYPTCEETGENRRECNVCYETEYETIAALGHTETNAGEPDIHTKCSVCQEPLTDGTAHDYTDSVMEAATCTENGVLRHTCACGWFYEEEIVASGHSYESKTDLPDDTGNGRTYEECSGCGDVRNEDTILALNAINFPDETFRNYLENEYNTDGQAGLTNTEIAAVTSLSLNGEGQDGQITRDGGISDLTGIGYFTQLQTLNVSCNANLTTLDISGNVTLVELDVHNTGIVSMDLAPTGYYAVAYLDIRETELSSVDFSLFSRVQTLKVNADMVELDLTSHQNLTDLYIGAGTTLTTLNVSGLSLLRNIVFEETTAITEIHATDLWLNSSVDFTKCPELVTLNMARTSISDFDFSQNNALTTLNLSGNTSLSILDLSNKSSLRQLIVSDCSMLQMLMLTGADNIEEFNVTNASSSIGNLRIYVTAQDTYSTDDIIGWDDTYMSMN